MNDNYSHIGTVITEYTKAKICSEYDNIVSEHQSLERQLENCKWNNPALQKRYDELDIIINGVKYGY